MPTDNESRGAKAGLWHSHSNWIDVRAMEKPRTQMRHLSIEDTSSQGLGEGERDGGGGGCIEREG